MAKPIKIKGIKKLISKNKARIIAGAGALAVIIGISVGSKACSSRPTVDVNTILNGAAGGVTSGQVKPDIYTPPAEDSIKDDVIFYPTTGDSTITTDPIIPIKPVNPGISTGTSGSNNDQNQDKTDSTPISPEDQTQDDGNTGDSDIKDNNITDDTITEIITPSEDKEQVKQNYDNLIAALNNRIRAYLEEKGYKKIPVISGLEKADVTQDGNNYLFAIQLEGSYDNENLSYFNLTLSNDSIEGANIYDLSLFDSVNLNEVLLQFEELISAEDTQILGIKTLNQANIINKEKAIKTVVPELSAQEIKNSTITAYIMTKTQTSQNSYVYENRVSVNTGSQTHFANIYIQSSTPIKSQQISEYISQILDGQIVDVEFVVETGVISNNKINDHFDKINDMLEETTYNK